jgi:glutamine amidotransferase
MIAIIDYDAGNLRSVEKALLYLGEKVVVTRDPEQIFCADHVILPGVGAFGDAMQKLNYYGLSSVIRQVTQENKPFLGICLGLQLLFSASEESPGVDGLGILEGSITAIPHQAGYKIPHMGWNSIKINTKSKLLHGIPQDSYVYFVHSFYLQAVHQEQVSATTEYTTTIHAAIEKENVYATQFHPEKSGELGLQILKNFCQLA